MSAQTGSSGFFYDRLEVGIARRLKMESKKLLTSHVAPAGDAHL
jgi:hypothetical protein